MIEYFREEDFFKAKSQRKKVLYLFYAVLAVYVIFSLGMFLWYRTLPYMSGQIIKVKVIHHVISVLFVIFTFIFMGIPFKRVNRYYKLTRNLLTGIRETSTGSFFEYDETLQDKDGVDFKSLVFIEWNKYKNDFFERKVLVFDEREFPQIKEGQNVTYVTQGNVLVSYKILEEN
ncbi:MAG: hypothetical protein E7373_04795 [Clostridiales bacterium]|nr:hypothetical protein [Clostridiales bacterium]